MPSVGIDRRTGQVLTGWEHVAQSIEDILTTRVLTRVMRREYGSENPKLVDSPMTDSVILDFYVKAAEALARWEPRFELTQIDIIDASADGRVSLQVSGRYYPEGHRGDRSQATAQTQIVTFGQTAPQFIEVY